jgi:hypothetical protein
MNLPPWAATGVGALPHADPVAAAEHAAAFELPCCPALPRLAGPPLDSLGRAPAGAPWFGADPLGCGWSPERDRERPAAWHAWLAALARRPPPHGWVKLQVPGPVTLAAGLGGDARLAREAGVWLAAGAAERVAALAAHGLRALVVADEPALAATGAGAAEAAEAWAPLREQVACFGVHTCGPPPWRLLADAELDLVALDLAAAPHAARDPGLRRHLARGGRVAWGVLGPGERPAIAAARLARAVAELGPEIGARSLLCGSCPTARATPREAEIADHAVRALAAGLRRTATARAPTV